MVAERPSPSPRAATGTRSSRLSSATWHDLHRDRGALRLVEPHQLVGDADDDAIDHVGGGVGHRHRLGRRAGDADDVAGRARPPSPARATTGCVRCDSPAPARRRRPGRPARRASTDGSNVSDTAAGVTCDDLDAVRHPDLVRQQVEEPRARPRRGEVEHRDDVAGQQPAEGAGRAAQADLDGVRRARPSARGWRARCGTRAARGCSARRRADRRRSARSRRPARCEMTLSPRWRNGW